MPVGFSLNLKYSSDEKWNFDSAVAEIFMRKYVEQSHHNPQHQVYVLVNRYHNQQNKRTIMGVPLSAALIGVAVAAYAIYKFWPREKDHEPSSRSQRNENQCRRIREPESVPTTRHNHGARYRGLSSNNHDHTKRQYDSKKDAEEVINRMRTQGADLDGRLKAYYNHDYGKWFVGNNCW